MKTISIVTIVSAAVILSGCDSSKDASKSNFTKVINDELSKQCIELYPVGLLNKTNFPKNPIQLELPSDKDSEKINDVRLSQLQKVTPFVKAGLLHEKDKQVKEDMGENLLPGKEYSLTEKGIKALKSPNSASFCAGHYKVDDIVDFTKPSEASGVTITKVRYTYSPDFPEWVTQDLKESRKDLQDSQSGYIELILTNVGWSAREFR